LTKHLLPAEQSITEDDASIAKALESASIPTLMAAIVHVSGDATVLDGPIRPNRAIMGEVQGFLSGEEKAEVRRDALRALAEYRDRGCTLPAPPSNETVHRMMNFVVGEEVPLRHLARPRGDHQRVPGEGHVVRVDETAPAAENSPGTGSG